MLQQPLPLAGTRALAHVDRALGQGVRQRPWVLKIWATLSTSCCPRSPHIPRLCPLQIYSPTGIPSFFTTQDSEMWSAVRKGCAPAFSPDNLRKEFPLIRCA